MGDLFKKNRVPFTYVDTPVSSRIPTRMEGYRGLIILGGTPTVTRPALMPFLREEMKALEDALLKGLPVLGVCLGAQMIARVLGARVYSDRRNREIGWYRTYLAGPARHDPIFRTLPKRLDLFHWHQDTFEIPRGCARLAYSNRCENQAFRFGSNTYALQFHVEMTREMLHEWVRSTTGILPLDRIFDEHLVKLTGLKRISIRFARGFLGRARHT